MKQNTKEWLKWRHSRIGSSDANIIMGVSKYMKRSELLLLKQTPFDQVKEKDSGPVAELGHIIEDKERSRFELMMDESFQPILNESKNVEYLSASYDGMNEKKTVAWEHKIMGKDMFAQVSSGAVPDQYYPQLQQQFFVTPSLEKIHLCVVKYEKSMLSKKLDPQSFQRASVIVSRDNNYINNILLPELHKFWEEVVSNKKFDHLDQFAIKRERIKNLIKKLNEKEKILVETITKEMGNNSQASTENYTFSKYKTSGRVTYDTKKMQSDGLDIDKYKKVGKESFGLRITRVKGKI